MSLGDRRRISLAIKTWLPAFTTKGDWLKCNLEVEVIKNR
jgi:PIN domain nuclease of toxin-antitoxin system